MKKLKLTALLLLFGTIIYGQENKLIGHVTLLKKNAVSVSGGIGNGKINNGNSLSTKGFGLDYFYAIKATKNFSWGLNGGANYFSGSSDPFAGTLPNPYKVTGEITNVVTGSGDSKNSGYFTGLGLQFNFALSDKLLFSPLFQVGYLGVTQSEFKATQTVVMNGFAVENYTKSYDLISQTQTQTSGMGVIPKIRMTYALSDNLGIWVEGNYLLGPMVKNSITTFKPEPAANQLGAYTIQQMNVGTYTTEVNETKHNAVGFNFGIVLGFGKNTDRNIHQYPGGTHAVVEKDNQVEKNTPIKDTNCIEYSAPQILNSNQNKNIQLDKKNLNILFKPSNAIAVNYKVLVWKHKKGKKELIHNAIYPSNFNGSIKDLKLDSGKTEELTVQLVAIPPQKENSKTIKSDKAAFQKAFCSTFTNNGESNVANYFVSNDTPCSPTYTKEITKVECIENGKIKVSGTYSITLPPGKTGSLSINSWNVLVDGVAATISNPSATISPLPITVTSGTIYNFSFEIEGGDACNKSLDILYNMNYVINCGTFVLESNIPCLMSYESLPCCYCNYCDKPENMNIITTSQSSTVASNNLGISQQMTITPKNISKITAEIVSIKESEVDEACKTCRKNQQGQLLENEVYHFIGNNTAVWSLGTPLAASSANIGSTFPTKIVEWKTNDKGAIDFNLSIALPGTAALSCCERHGVVCIRYSFTDIECKTCSVLVCYPY
jgi:hypothetical protein